MKRERQLIKESIKIWKKRIKPEYYTKYKCRKLEECPLCQYDEKMYQKNRKFVNACEYCPIFKLTDKPLCRNTFYSEWSIITRLIFPPDLSLDFRFYALTDENDIKYAIRIAEEMVGMLECLLDYDEHVKMLKSDGSLV